MSSQELPVRKWQYAGRCTYASVRFSWVPVFTVLLVAVVLIATESFLLATRHPHIRLVSDSREARYVLNGFHAPEHDSRGAYRWSQGTSQIRLYQFGAQHTIVFGLKLGPLPPEVARSHFTLDYGGQTRVSATAGSESRMYRMLVPREDIVFNSLIVNVHSDTTHIPPDTRTIGLRVEEANVHFIGTSIITPSIASMIVQCLLLLFTGLIVQRLQASQFVCTIVLLLVAGFMLLLFRTQMLLTYTYFLRFAIALCILTLLTYALLPLLYRYATWIGPPELIHTLWGITLLACVIRLAGSLYPLFAAYDLFLNVGRFMHTLYGSLVDTGKSIEFRNSVTLYPSGPYVLLLPGMLVGTPPSLLVQGSLAIIDGFGAFTIAAFARVLTHRSRAAIFSALLYAAIPIHLTALWYGLTAQIFGQALMVPLAIALLFAFRYGQSSMWTIAVILLSMSLISHIGVAILAVAWLGVAWVVLRVWGKVSLPTWWRFTHALILSCLVGLALVYSTFALLKLEQFMNVGQKIMTSGYTPAYNLIFTGFSIAFHKMGFVLLLPGLVLLMRHRMPYGASALLGSWLAVIGVFWAVEMMTALQVRYIYFLTPLACLSIGLLFDTIAMRGRVAWGVTWGIVVFFLIQGSIYWYTGTFNGVMMSVSPLLR